ncbi:MAG: V-type ATP synthase subunit D [Limnochordia bacterium]|jgi:V/A-type H+-transporting ATPase subunit D
MQRRVNPNRMELLRLRSRLSTAERGHKLLKDKHDELMQRFLELVWESRDLRVKVEEQLEKVSTSMVMATATASPAVIESALLFPKQRLDVQMRHDSIVGVPIVRFDHSWESVGGEADHYPYGPAHTPADLDAAIKTLSEALSDLVRLAELEKAAELLAVELERTRRRVNALEYVLIPQLQESIRYITMKLDEAERSNIVRLMKVKQMNELAYL